MAKTLLMENGGIASRKTIEFVKSIDPNYQEYNTEIREYMRNNDLYLFAALIDPELENLVTSSAFEHGMPYHAYDPFNKEFNVEYGECGFKQIEYYSWIIREAVLYRKHKNSPGLNIHINYLYPDFLESLKKEELGPDTTLYIKLMLRQAQDHTTLFIYDDYQLKYTLKTEEDLKLNI